MRILAALAIFVVACADAPDTSQTTQLATIAGGSFETGDYTGWTLLETPPELTTSGTFGIAQDGQTITSGAAVHDFFDNLDVGEGSPGLPITYDATDGTFVALHLQNGAQNHRMFQTVALDNCLSKLVWDMAYDNHADEIGQTFDPGRQFFAINVRDPATDAVLATPFKLADPAPLTVLAMTTFEADLSAFDGQTVEIDFEHQVQNFFFDIAWDNIRLECNQPPALAVPALVDFGKVRVNTASAPKLIQLDSVGQSDLTITSATTAAPFVIVSNNLPAAVPVGSNLSLSAVFSPSVLGPVNGSVVISSDDPTGDKTVQVTGIGVAPAISAPASVAFGSVPVGSAGLKNALISNPGTDTLSITSITGVGPFDSTTAVPVTIAAGSSKNIQLRFTPGAGGNAAGTITITSDADTSPTEIDVTGTGTVSQVSFDATVLDFGDQLVGTTSSNKTVKLTNTGGANLIVSSIATSAPYSLVSPTTFPFTVTPGNNVLLTLTFTPGTAAVINRDLTVVSNAATSPDVVTLTGRGVEPLASLNIDPLDFGPQRIGVTSASKKITLTNTGTSDLTVNALSTTLPFAIVSPATPFTVAAGDSIDLDITFTPAASGAVSDNLTVTSDAANGTISAGLTGVGVEPLVSLDVATLPFGNQRIGAPSAAHTVTLTNTGTSTLTITSITTSAPFEIVSPVVAGSLAPAESLAVDVIFTPSVIGAANQFLVFQTDAAVASSTVALTGTGTVATFDAQPSSLGFGDIRIGTASVAQQLTITNLGGGALAINSITAPAGVIVTGPAFPVGVLPGAQIVFDVVFSPAAAGSLGGNLTIQTAVGSTDVPLAGNGVAAALTADATQLDFGKVRIGEASDAQTITLTNVTAAPITIASATPGDPQFVLDPPPPATPIAPGGTATFAIRYVPAASGSASSQVDIALTGGATEVTVEVAGSGVGGGSGCNAAGGSSAWLGLALLGLLRRRRR